MSTIILRGFKRKIILALLLFITACDEQTEQKTITLAHGLDIQHPVHEAMLYMNDRLKQYSNDKMRLQIFASGQLGSEREVLELLQIGSVGMTKVSASSIEAFVPKMKIFSVPYLFTSQEHLWRILNGDIGRTYLTKVSPFESKV